MAISNAVNLANLSSKDTFVVDSQNDRVGIATTTPTEALTVVGVVSATSFFGDGSNLEGVASAGLGTALGDGTNGLEVIYFTDKVLTISDTITVDPPASTNIAYTQYSEVAVADTKDLIIADGDDFIPDILGLSTEGGALLGGAGGRVRADNFTNRAGNGAPNFPSGLTGNVTGNITGTTGTFTGNVSVGGTITYEDVTNVDSVGIVTARTGITVLAGGINAVGVVTATGVVSSGSVQVGGAPNAGGENGTSLSQNGQISLSRTVGTQAVFRAYTTGDSVIHASINGNGSAGFTTITASTINVSAGANLNGYKVEEGDIETTSLNGEFDYNLENGHIQKFTGATGGNYQPDFKVNGSTSLSSIMDVGDVVTCTLMVASSSHYLASASIKIDNSASNLDIDNVGGSAPNAANGSGFDIYTFTIQKTAATPAYHIVVNALGAN